MPTTRLEAFSDAVLAIIITMMALELKPPEGESLASLWRATGVGLLSYVVSFLYVGIYWNNHHHLLNAVQKIDSAALWANLNLLFWISLMPLTTSWVDETNFAASPLAMYGADLLASAVAFLLLQRALMRQEPDDAPLRRALGRDTAGWLGRDSKGKVSLILYALGIVAPLLTGLLPQRGVVAFSLVCFVAVAVIWVVPDRRVADEATP